MVGVGGSDSDPDECNLPSIHHLSILEADRPPSQSVPDFPSDTDSKKRVGVRL